MPGGALIEIKAPGDMPFTRASGPRPARLTLRKFRAAIRVVNIKKKAQRPRRGAGRPS